MTRRSRPSAPLPALAADSLAGDVAAFLVDWLSGRNTAARQQDTMTEARLAAGRLVDAVAAVIAAEGHDGVAVVLRKVENDGAKIRVTLEAGREDGGRHRLFDAAGGDGWLVLADAGRYAGHAEKHAGDTLGREKGKDR